VRVLLAPDSFKGSITATAAAAALARGWLAERPGDQVSCLPLADGGEGTLDVLAAATPGARWHRALVTGPGNAPVDCAWLELPGAVAAVELARASGLPLLPRPDPLRSHTVGLGQVIGRVLDQGAQTIVIGLGGSASTDGGTGALAALGARFLDAAGDDLPPGGGALASLAAVDTSRLRPPSAGGVTCLADVTAPLLGPLGAAAVFGPRRAPGRRRSRAWRRDWRGWRSCWAAIPAPPARARRAARGTASRPAGGRPWRPGLPNWPAWPGWAGPSPGPTWSSPARAGSTPPRSPARRPGR